MDNLVIKEQDLEKILRFIPDPVYIINLLGTKEVLINQHFTEVFGYVESDLIPEKIGAIFADEYGQIAVEETIATMNEYNSGEKLRQFCCDVMSINQQSIFCEINIDKVDNYVVFHFRDLRIQKQFEETIVEKNLQLKLQKIELSKLNEELNLERNKAYKAAKVKSDFLANMSHEIRTPLNSIIGFATILGKNREQNLTDKQIKQVNNIYASGNHLLSLINDLLDLAKIESGKMDVHLETGHIINNINEVIATTVLLADKKELTLDFIYDSKDSTLKEGFFDVKRFKQILYNLISNAIKFTDQGGITVSVERYDSSFVKIIIRDTGIGIAVKDHHKIFKEFEQIDSSATRRYDGTGLGLALTKNLVELHGGKIWFESDTGQGTTFSFTISSPS